VSERVRIRNADANDAAVLAAMGARTFRDTFAADNTPTDMEAYLAKAFSVGRMASELADPGNWFLLALSAPTGEVAGYAKLRTGSIEPSVSGPAPLELQRLYVERSAMGGGFGAALMEACLATARADGFQTLWLGVWEHNARALAFYRRWGFEVVGAHEFRLGEDVQTDLIMQRPVAGVS
jgi:diamine N-acetyltransferase